MPFDYWDYMGLDTSAAPTAMPGQVGGYEGDGLEDFYDFLMTPRRQQRWSGSGAIKHFGPDRYASINPEDAAMADIIMKQMEQEKAFAAGEEMRQSELARRRAQDELLMPRGKGGGSISFKGKEMETGGYAGPRGTKWGHPGAELQVGGGLPEGPPQRPDELTDADWALLGGQGVPTARAQAEVYEARRGRGGATNYQISNAMKDLDMVESEVARLAAADEELAGKKVTDLLGMYQSDPNSLPPLISEQIAKYGVLKRHVINLAQQAEAEPWDPNGGGGS